MATGEPADVRRDRGTARLDATVVNLDTLERGQFPGNLRIFQVQNKHVVATPVTDRSRRLPLPVHGIGGTIRPFNSSISRCTGMTAISLDFTSTATCPSITRTSAAKARTWCSGDLPAAPFQGPPFRQWRNPVQFSCNARHEALHCRLERFRIQCIEQIREGIMARNPVLRAQEGPQERFS